MNATYVPVSQIQAEVSLLLNDVGKARWTQAVLDAAYNYAIGEWNQRINIPVIIDSTQGWATSNWSPAISEYKLPLGLDPNMVIPQYRRNPFGGTGIAAPVSTIDSWVNFAKFSIEPPSGSTGEWVLRFPATPYAAPARLVAFIGNSRLPSTARTVAAELPAAVGTNLVLNGAWDGSKSGFLLVDREVVAFAGVQNATLLNIVRNLNGDGIAVHDVLDTVNVVAAFEEQQDRSGFIDTMIAACHRMYLNNAASADQNFHQQMVTYYDNRVSSFWRRRSPQRKTRMVLSEFSHWN